MNRAFRSAICSLASATLLMALPAHAQQEEPRDTLEPVLIEPVLVTVLRTPFSVTEAPYAVAVNTRTQIQRAQPGLGLDEALRGIPGVQVDNRYNYALGERISIRGFGARSQFGVRGIKVLVDGIPATLPDGQTALNHVDLSLVQRAEVIRGPASSLYGNTAGGVVQLETELPPARRLAQEVGIVTGSDGLLRAHSTTGGRSGRASYQLHLARMAVDGHREFSSAENLYLNGRLGFTTEKDDFRLILNAVDYDARNPGSLSEELLREDRFQAYSNNVRQQTGEVGRQGQLGLSWRRQTAAGEWEVSSYALGRSIENPIPPAIIALDRTVGGLRGLFRSTPRADTRFQWTVGAEGDLQRDDRRNFANEEGRRGDLRLNQLESVSNLGLFTQLSATPLPRLTLLSGLRYDWFRFEAEDRLVSDSNPDDSGSRDLDAFSPSLGANLALSDALHLYTNVATSFETPTTTELANRPSGAGGFNPELEPQRATSFELGAKGRVNNWLAYQLAGYRADIADALIPFEIPEAAGRQFFRNAGSALHQGVEAAATLSPWQATTLQASYTYTDARFEDYTVDGESLSGNQVPGIAPHRAEVSLTYEAPRNWFATVQGRYASELPVNDANTAHSPAYVVTDLRVGLDAVRVGRVRATPFVGVNNLFDEEYNTSVTVNAFGRRYFEPGPGRSFYTGLTMQL